MIVSANAHATLIRTTARKLGASLPEAFEQAITDAQALREATQRIEGNAAAVNQRIINCLRDGQDWRTDKQVQALMFERVAAANGIRQAGEEAATDSVAQAIAEHADTIIASWADALSQAATTLTDAAQRLDIDDLDPREVDMQLLSRKNLVPVWAEANSAAERFTTALNGWRAIATATQLPRQRQHEPLILTDAALSVIDGTRTGNRNEATAWSLARAGAKLHLATLNDYTLRVSRYTAEQQERQRALQAAR
ncbi:hypothetical protein M4D79_14140 [Mycolicibacterium novocastrense]|nr:hypothetical protein M4D79_14140 [Mycolicibacterium novocastrense]